MAVNSTLPLLVYIALIAAPVPRPPQPTNPILIVSDPNACADRASDTLGAATTEPQLPRQQPSSSYFAEIRA